MNSFSVLTLNYNLSNPWLILGLVEVDGASNGTLPALIADIIPSLPDIDISADKNAEIIDITDDNNADIIDVTDDAPNIISAVELLTAIRAAATPSPQIGLANQPDEPLAEEIFTEVVNFSDAAVEEDEEKEEEEEELEETHEMLEDDDAVDEEVQNITGTESSGCDDPEASVDAVADIIAVDDVDTIDLTEQNGDQAEQFGNFLYLDGGEMFGQHLQHNGVITHEDVLVNGHTTHDADGVDYDVSDPGDNEEQNGVKNIDENKNKNTGSFFSHVMTSLTSVATAPFRSLLGLMKRK